MPVVYVNDNYGDFAANQETLVPQALDGERPDLVKPNLPEEGVRFLQKVRHSAFYATALAYLLRQLRIERLILTGQVTEQCILYSALDADVRGFAIRIPRDAVCPIIPELGDAALEMMERNMGAEVVEAADAIGG